jgi:AraC-like DNA-binding protein
MQALILILLLGVVQGLLLVVLFLQRQLWKKGYFFLLAYLSVIILQLSFKLISKHWLLEHVHVTYMLSYQLPFLYGPLLYLFVTRAFQSSRFRPIQFAHFIPFAIVFVHFALFRADASPIAVIRPFFEPLPRLLLQISSLISYHLLAFHKIRATTSTDSSLLGAARLLHEWTPKFIRVSFIVTSVIAATNYFMYIFYPDLQPVRFGFALLTLFVYWVTYCVLRQPQLFSVVRGFNATAAADSFVPKLFIQKGAKKYANSTLSDADGERIGSQLDRLLTQKKIYRDPELNADMIAEQIGCSKHHLSQFLNESLRTSFNDYVNHFRVEEVKSLLVAPNREQHKIASIAFDAGFNSISTFNEVFKKFTGTTPSTFRTAAVRDSRKQRV